MIEAVSCGGVVIYKWKILLLYKNQNGRYIGLYGISPFSPSIEISSVSLKKID